MKETIGKNKMVVALVVVVVAVGLWYAMTRSAGEEALLSTQEFAGVSNGADKELVSTLLALRSVSLEGGIFSDPAFMSLQDFGSQIVPEAAGRTNPFAPLGTPVRATTTSALQQKGTAPSGPQAPQGGMPPRTR